MPDRRWNSQVVWKRSGFRKIHFKHLSMESPAELAMLCKVENFRHGEAHGENKPNTRISRDACIVEAHESTSKRLEKTQPQDHEDRIAGKVFNSSSHYNLVQKIISLLRAMKIGDA